MITLFVRIEAHPSDATSSMTENGNRCCWLQIYKFKNSTLVPIITTENPRFETMLITKIIRSDLGSNRLTRVSGAGADGDTLGKMYHVDCNIRTWLKPIENGADSATIKTRVPKFYRG